MSLSWRLWRALLHAPTHYARMKRGYLIQQIAEGRVLPDDMTDSRPLPKSILQSGGLILILALLLPLTFWSFLCLTPLFLVGTIVASVFYGLRSAWSVSAAISDEQAKGTYDLLCVIPSGVFGVNWSLCIKSLRQNQSIETIERVFAALVIAALSFTLVLTAILIVSNIAGSGTSLAGIPMLAGVSAMLSALYLNLGQSIVIGSLIGMLAPTYTRVKTDTQMLALLGFLSAIIVTLAIAALIGTIILPLFYAPFAGDPLVTTTLPLMQLLVFYLAREMTVRWLWGQLMARMNVSGLEVDTTLHYHRA